MNRGAQPTAQTFAPGDRVRVRSTGRIGTVATSRVSPRGNFVAVRLDGEGKRTQRFLASSLARAESLFKPS